MGGKPNSEQPGYFPTDFDPLLRARECAALLSCSEPTFWRRVSDGTLPQPVRIGGMSRWPTSEILAVIEQAKSARLQSSPSEKSGAAQ